jgi:hypothetical protein
MAKYCSHRDAEGHSTYRPSPRGKFEVCNQCSDRFPCGDQACAHFDCREARGQQPKCYYCEETLQAAKKYDTWTIIHKRGGDVTAHYCCRDSHAHTPRADLVARARGSDPYYPEPCPHKFEDKQPMDLRLLKTMAEAVRTD